MANKHLLPCDCGDSVEVEPSQAGERVRCQCGATLEVPPLRVLRTLPQAQDENPAGKARAQWSVRHGVLTAGLLASALIGGLGVWWWATEPPMPAIYDPAQAQQLAADAIEKMTPAEGYRRWATVYLPQERLQNINNPAAIAGKRRVEQSRLVRTVLLAAAALCAAGSVAAFVLLKPRGQRGG